MYLRHGEPGMNEAREANLALRPFRLARPFPTVFRRPVRPLKYYLSKSSRERKTAAVDRSRGQNVSSTKADNFSQTETEANDDNTTPRTRQRY